MPIGRDFVTEDRTDDFIFLLAPHFPVFSSEKDEILVLAGVAEIGAFPFPSSGTRAVSWFLIRDSRLELRRCGFRCRSREEIGGNRGRLPRVVLSLGEWRLLFPQNKGCSVSAIHLEGAQ
jgi:hypothetical protein